MSQVKSVPFIDISRYENGFLESFLPKVENLVRKTQFVMGPDVTELEVSLARYVEAAWAVGCANGTDALQIALRGAGVGPGDKVLIPDMTFWATYEAVVNVGATPVTADVDLETLHLSHEMFLEAVEKFRPKAALLVHLYGWAAPDTEKIRESARKKNIILIEDAAQAFGTRLNGKSLIAGASLSTTSFYPAKVLGASGDAGALFTQDESLAKKLRQLVNHGRTDHYSYGLVGWNSRIGVYESAFLNVALPNLNQRIESRRKTCRTYREELGGLPIRMLSPAKEVLENGYCSVSIVEPQLRNELTAYLKEKQIGFGTIYPGAMSRQVGNKGTLGGSIDHGHADQIARSVLNLPCFAYMTESETAYVVESVKKFFGK